MRRCSVCHWDEEDACGEDADTTLFATDEYDDEHVCSTCVMMEACNGVAEA